MTIAAGFVCLDGLVLCADTQETIQGYTKSKTDKIWEESDAQFGIAVTGSGDSEALKTLSQQIVDDVMGSWQRSALLYTYTARKIIQKTVQKFTREHLLIYPQAERPYVEGLLIGMREHHNHDLFKVTGTMLREVKADGDAIGSGALLAKSWKEKQYDPFMDLDELVVVACYIIYQAKQYADGCDGNTDMLIYSHKHNYAGGAPTAAIKELEALFEEFDSWVSRDLILGMTPGMRPDNATMRSQRLKQWIDEVAGKTKETANLQMWMQRLRAARLQIRSLLVPSCRYGCCLTE